MNEKEKNNLDLGNLITLDEQRVKEIFDHDYQNKFISLILKEEEADFFSSISDIIVPSYFDDYQRILIDKIIKDFQKHSKTPDYEDLKRIIRIEERNELKKEHLIGLIDKISSTNIKSNKAIKDISFSFFKKKALANALYKMASLWGKNDFDSMVTPLVEALKMGEKKEDAIDYVRDIDITLQESVRNTIKIMDGIDEEIGGGIAKGELAVIMAPTGGGKSMVLVAMAANAIRDGRKVLYVSLELGKVEVAKRFQSCFTGIHLKELKFFPDVIKENANEVFGIDDLTSKNERNSVLKIKKFPTRRLTVAQLKNCIDSLERNENFKTEIIFLDYADIMNSSAYDKEHRLALQILYQDLRGLSEEVGVPLITACQTSRSASKLKYITIDHIAESYAKAAEADLVLGVGRGIIDEKRELNEDGSPKTLSQINKATFGFLKNRMGSDSFYCDANFCTSNVQISIIKKDQIQGLENGQEKNFSPKITEKTANDSINSILEREMGE